MLNEKQIRKDWLKLVQLSPFHTAISFFLRGGGGNCKVVSFEIGNNKLLNNRPKNVIVSFVNDVKGRADIFVYFFPFEKSADKSFNIYI